MKSKLPIFLILASFLCVALGYFIGITTQPQQQTVISEPEVAEQNHQTNDTPSSDNKLVKSILKEDLGGRYFSFSQVVESSTGKKILSFDPNNAAHRELHNVIQATAQESLAELNQKNSPIKGLRRINEASRFFEDKLLEKINAHPDFSCHIPKNSAGKEQRSGYPDLRIVHLATNTNAFLDPKLYEDKSETSSFRTFYYEPKANNIKIHYDGLHFLLGIKHDGKDGDWTFTGLKIVDVAKLKVRLKAEFQASNRDMYKEDLILK